MKRGGMPARKTPLRRTELRGGTVKRLQVSGEGPSAVQPVPPRALPRQSKIKPRSSKLTREMRLYVPEMLEFLDERPVCEFPLGCGQRSEVLHHRKGRGSLLRVQEFWAASCHFHNDFAETRTGEALACGWLLRIEGVA